MIFSLKQFQKFIVSFVLATFVLAPVSVFAQSITNMPGVDHIEYKTGSTTQVEGYKVTDPSKIKFEWVSKNSNFTDNAANPFTKTSHQDAITAMNTFLGVGKEVLYMAAGSFTNGGGQVDGGYQDDVVLSPRPAALQKFSGAVKINNSGRIASFYKTKNLDGTGSFDNPVITALEGGLLAGDDYFQNSLYAYIDGSGALQTSILNFSNGNGNKLRWKFLAKDTSGNEYVLWTESFNKAGLNLIIPGLFSTYNLTHLFYLDGGGWATQTIRNHSGTGYKFVDDTASYGQNLPIAYSNYLVMYKDDGTTPPTPPTPPKPTGWYDITTFCADKNTSTPQDDLHYSKSPKHKESAFDKNGTSLVGDAKQKVKSTGNIKSMIKTIALIIEYQERLDASNPFNKNGTVKKYKTFPDIFGETTIVGAKQAVESGTGVVYVDEVYNLLEDYQKGRDIKVDGIVGVETSRQIGIDSAFICMGGDLFVEMPRKSYTKPGDLKPYRGPLYPYGLNLYTKNEKSQPYLADKKALLAKDDKGTDPYTGYVDENLDTGKILYINMEDKKGWVDSGYRYVESGPGPGPSPDNNKSLYLIPDNPGVISWNKVSDGAKGEAVARNILWKILDFLLGFIGVIAVAMMCYGGWLYMTAAGEDTKKGTDTLMWSGAGLIVIILAEQVVGIIFPTKDGLRDGASRLDKGEAFNTDAAGSELIITVLNWGLGFVAVIAVAMMIYGGFTYLTAGITEKQDDGRKMVINSIIGLIIILISFAAVNIVIKGVLAIG